MSGDDKALESMKEAAVVNPTAAYYMANIFDKGYYRHQIDSQLSLAYYCLASYLGSLEATEYLQKHKSSVVERCLNYIQILESEGQINFDQIVTMIKTPQNSPESEIVSSEDAIYVENRKMRDNPNKEEEMWKEKRDALNAEIKSIATEISDLSMRRNELNNQVKELKNERNQYNKLANEARTQLKENDDLDQECVEKLKDNVNKNQKYANEKHQQMIDIANQSQTIQNRINELSSEKNNLTIDANNAHKQWIKHKPQTCDIRQSDDRDTTKAIFLDFIQYMNDIKFHDPIFGTNLREQFKTSSVKTSYVDVIELFKNRLLKESITLYISTPNYKKEWKKDKKCPHIRYFNNVSLRMRFSDTHDLVLITDLVDNAEERSRIGFKFYVKGFVFIDMNVVHPHEIKVSGRVFARLGNDKNTPWVDCKGTITSTKVNNQINSKVIDFLEDKCNDENNDCIQYMNTWKRYLDSRQYILQENEKQKLELTSVNLQIVTFCDECTDEIRSHYEKIPYIKLPREKRQDWFIDTIDDEHCRRVLLLHISKDYGNIYYRKYVDKTDFSFKKEFDQFTRDGLKLFGDETESTNEYDFDESENRNADYGSNTNESILDTYDSRISNTFVEIIYPIQKIKSLEAKYSDRRIEKEKELADKRDKALDNAQKEYRTITLLSDIKSFKNTLTIAKSDLELFAKTNSIELKSSNIKEIESRYKEELISAEVKRLIDGNYVSLKTKFDIQFTNALSDFDSRESIGFNAEKESIVKEYSTLRLHAYFDLSENYDIADENRIKALNNTITNLEHPYIRRNLDGDRILLKRQSEGIENLMQGYVMNPYLTSFLFKPTYMARSDVVSENTEFFQNLNNLQKETVIKAISSNGLYLIQGPPGTGKTQTIAEIATQLAKMGKKVLIASQNNKAVDTAFNRLPEMPCIRPVRVLRDSKDNQYSYDNLTDNLYKNIIGSLKRQIKKHSDERKYVDEYKILIERLTNMKDSIEKIELQLGDLERDIENHENNKSHYLSELIKIRQEIFDNQQKESNYTDILTRIKTGNYNDYVSIIGEWPEGLSSLSSEQKEMFLRSLIQMDEDDFMEALVNPESIEKLDSNDTELESDDVPSMTVEEMISIFNSSYPDNLDAYETYQSIIDQIYKKSEKEEKKSRLCSMAINKLHKKERDINDKLVTEDNYIRRLQQDAHYQALLKERDDFNKEVSLCFSELEIEAELDQESAIEIIKRSIGSIKRKLDDKKSNLEERIAAYQKIVDYLSDGDVLYADKSRINSSILKYVNVIGVTCSRASPSTRIKYTSNDKEQNLKLNSLNIDVVILDETSKIPFSELVPPILYGKSVILVGDHRQLPPIYSEIKRDDYNLYDSSKINQEDEDCYRRIYTDSFFGKLFQQTSSNCKSTLTVQYRMHPQIMELVNTFYPDTPLEFGGRLYDKEHRISIRGTSSQILTQDRHVLFINCNGHEKRESGTMSSYNTLEAETIVRLLDLLNDNCKMDRSGNPIGEKTDEYDNRLSLGVICPYRGQVNRIRDLKKASYRSFNESTDEKFMISTVDNFQGDERDIIILSMVRTEQCDWLSEYRRINVAISRARRLLIIVGNEFGLSNINVTIETSDGPINKKAYMEIIKKISESGCRIESSEIIGGAL